LPGRPETFNAEDANFVAGEDSVAVREIADDVYSADCRLIAQDNGEPGDQADPQQDSDADPAKLERMIQTTERYCVILQTLRNPPKITVG